MKLTSGYNYKRFTLITALLCCLSTIAHALAPDYYAANSVLATGNWKRVSIAQTGISFISNTELRSMGFSDPSKVNVYGLGGQMIPEFLFDGMADDLPLVPCVRTETGLLFFGVDAFSWQSASGDTPYTHTFNPYSEDAVYFLSDRDVTTPERPHINGTPTSSTVITTFTDRRVHEVDQQAPSNTGRVLLGESFVTQNSRPFTFNLTDIADDDVTYKINFATNITGTGSSGMLNFTINGKPVGTEGVRTPPLTDSEQFMRVTQCTNTVSHTDSKFELGIKFNPSGAVNMARLDYIEVFYTRALKLNQQSLYFFEKNRNDVTLEVEGCNASTIIWDVTEPWNIRQVDYALSGTKARFNSPGGYHEYVAFNPGDKFPAVTGAKTVANQDIHGMATPDMVIIANAEFKEAAERIANLHREDGLEVYVLQPNEIYNEFAGGKQDVTAFRKLLKMWHDRPGERSIKYALLIGRPIYDHKMVSSELAGLGYTPLPIWQSSTGTMETTSYSTDDYIAMLEESNPDVFSPAIESMQVAVGRIPASTASEAMVMADKIERYMKTPDFGTWRNRIMLIADDGDNGIHFNQSEKVYSILTTTGNANAFQYDKLFLDAYKLVYTGTGAAYPDAKEKMLQAFNDGVGYINYIGHANAKSWSHENLLTWNDITSQSNRNLPWLYAATCSFGKWDNPSVSGAEYMLLNRNGGVIGIIAPSRTVYMAQNGQLNNHMANIMYTRDEEGKALTFAEAMRQAKNRYIGDDNRLRYCFMGDPALRIYNPAYTVKITEVDGQDVTGRVEEFPVIEALSKVVTKGTIIDTENNVMSDFNGTLHLQLYDAEQVITTNGNNNGVALPYNDRRIKLTSTIVEVKNGQWEATLMMPAEIQNNYSPARIVGYAYSEDGSEANGSTEKLYVYGYSTNDNTDTAGPTVSAFYLNNADYFGNGGVINTKPVVFATISDESGINLSDAGIGHKMRLTLDGNKVFDDVNQYYTQDITDPCMGNIIYPMSELTPGDHTLALTVWDNANNSTTVETSFMVGAAIEPAIRDLYTDVAPATTAVTITCEIDRPNTAVETDIEVFDLNGKRLYKASSQMTTDYYSRFSTKWDLTDNGGTRVPRGIYIYRATVRTPEGTYSSKSRKLAVTGVQ